MTSIFFQAVGKPVQAVVSSMVRDILCFIPLIIIFPLTIGGVESILYAAPVADAIAMVIATVLTLLFMRSIRANKEDKLPPLDGVKENVQNALCLFGEFLYKHSLFRRRNARSSGDEEGSAEHQTRVRSCGCALFFCTNATSGIMRRRRLMCESRVCPHPKGFADSKRGKHVRKGDISLICSHLA